jgi:uncharacterized protein YqjF (DUF2071 family)
VIDRLSPTRRPARRPVGYQSWRELLFLHWPVSTEALRPLVPAQLSLDLYQGVAYVGLTPFVVQYARAAWAPHPFSLDFLETNVRTYVHFDGRDPGVYFFSLDAASRIAVAGARAAFGLPYWHARIRRHRHDGVTDYGVRRLSHTRPRLTVTYQLGQPLGAADPGTLEHFLVERYLLHVERRGALWTTQVHHSHYPLQQAQVLEIRDELIRAAGLPEPGGPPPLVHYAPGVDVEIFPPQRRRDARGATVSERKTPAPSRSRFG